MSFCLGGVEGVLCLGELEVDGEPCLGDTGEEYSSDRPNSCT